MKNVKDIINAAQDAAERFQKSRDAPLTEVKPSEFAGRLFEAFVQELSTMADGGDTKVNAQDIITGIVIFQFGAMDALLQLIDHTNAQEPDDVESIQRRRDLTMTMVRMVLEAAQVNYNRSTD